MSSVQDRIDIEDIVRRERICRDMKRWDDLAACYNDDSWIDISWFQGSGAEFARAGSLMASKMLSFHELGPMTVTIAGTRAITDMGVTIHLIAEMGGVEVDCVGFCRSLGRVERKSDRWLMAGHRVIYLHDWIIPTVPGEVPAISTAKLKSYRPSYRYLSYMLEGRGLPARDDLPGIDRPNLVEKLMNCETTWLEGGA
jgi:hypothetical protein